MKTLPTISVCGLLAVLAGVVAGCHMDELLTDPAGGAPPSPSPGAPTQLVFVVQPSNAMSDSVIEPPVQVAARDDLGNTATNFTGLVRVALGNDGSLLKNARLSGTDTVRAVNGVATFADLSIDELGDDYTLTAAFATGPPVVSDPFDITVAPGPGPAPTTQLLFTVPPSSTPSRSTIQPPVEVTAVDAQGVRVTSFTRDVTIAIGRNGGLLIPGTLSGRKTVAAVGGVARFDDLSIDQAGNGYTLRITASGLTGESGPFNITLLP